MVGGSAEEYLTNYVRYSRKSSSLILSMSAKVQLRNRSDASVWSRDTLEVSSLVKLRPQSANDADQRDLCKYCTSML